MIKIVSGQYSKYQESKKRKILKNKVVFDISRICDLTNQNEFEIILKSIRLSNGTYKTTKSNRFDKLDSKMCSILKDYFNQQTLTVHDFAVSDGSTSLDLYDNIVSLFNIDLTISDKYNSLYVKKYMNGLITLCYDSSEQFISGSFWLIYANKMVSYKYFVTRILGKFFSSLKVPSKYDNEIHLLNPRIKRMINSGDISFVVYDIFQFDCEEKYDFVRCMNLLNLSYFDKSKIEVAIRNIYKIVNENGVVLIGRTHKQTDINDASFFQKRGEKLVEIEVMNQGSEIAKLVKELNF
jgi:hypothetical protein